MPIGARVELHSDDFSSSQVEVVVEFTERYNSEAQNILADVNMSPKLYGCHSIVGG